MRMERKRHQMYSNTLLTKMIRLEDQIQSILIGIDRRIKKQKGGEIRYARWR